MPLDSSSDVPRGISNFIKEFSSKDERVFQKGLDVLIDARGVFSGGVDITDTVIQRLNSNGGMK